MATILIIKLQLYIDWIIVPVLFLFLVRSCINIGF